CTVRGVAHYGAADYASFFFSSRRRHTRFSRDWSSDVCSSDLNFLCHLVGYLLTYFHSLFLLYAQNVTPPLLLKYWCLPVFGDHNVSLIAKLRYYAPVKVSGVLKGYPIRWLSLCCFFFNSIISVGHCKLSSCRGLPSPKLLLVSLYKLPLAPLQHPSDNPIQIYLFKRCCHPKHFFIRCRVHTIPFPMKYSQKTALVDTF